MKVLYIGNGLTQYYNLVLSKLNNISEVDLVVVAPSQVSDSIGAGVYQTKDGINFKVIELAETRKLGFYNTFKGLPSILINERPDVVIVVETYLRAFMFDVSLVLAMKWIRAGLILKSIPFRYLLYQDAINCIKESDKDFASIPSLVNKILRKLRLIWLIRRGILFLDRLVLNRPNAHVNYVEAYKYWESYGVSNNKIFITRNSPDTDMLFLAKKKVEAEPTILPYNRYRLLHVGRLVEWKRVDMLLRSFAHIKKHFPDSELLIIGSGPEEEKLKAISNELKIGSSVLFLGAIYDQQQLAKYYLASSLYILAGMGGLSINEAMCFGLPILCSVCDGTEKYLVQDGVNGRFFCEGAEKDLVEKITWFFEHPEEMERMGACSEEIIRKDVNIHTVIHGYMDALKFAARHKLHEASIDKGRR